MPSPTWSTVPTSARSVSTAKSSMRCLRMVVISSGRSFKTTPYSKGGGSTGAGNSLLRRKYERERPQLAALAPAAGAQPELLRQRLLMRCGLRSVYVFVDEHFFALHVKGFGFSVANGETVFTNPAQSATSPVPHVIVAFTTPVSGVAPCLSKPARRSFTRLHVHFVSKRRREVVVLNRPRAHAAGLGDRRADRREEDHGEELVRLDLPVAPDRHLDVLRPLARSELQRALRARRSPRPPAPSRSACDS